MNHPALESCSGINLEWWGDSCFIVCVLDLRGEAIDVTCALQLQLHLTEYKSNKSPESSSRPQRKLWETELMSQHTAAELWTQTDTKRKQARAEPIWVKADTSEAYRCANRKISGPLSRKIILGIKCEKIQKPQDIFVLPSVVVPRVRQIRTSLEAMGCFFFFLSQNMTEVDTSEGSLVYH